MEETQLTIKNLRYFKSQPWPYPCGLMVGFFAEYERCTGLLHKVEGGFQRSGGSLLGGLALLKVAVTATQPL